MVVVVVVGGIRELIPVISAPGKNDVCETGSGECEHVCESMEVGWAFLCVLFVRFL